MLKKSLLLATAALFLLSVTLFDPATISRWIESSIGWQPLREQSTSAENPSLHAAVSRINAGDLQRHLRVLTADASRVTGYPGAQNAARYLEQEFRSLGLQVSSEAFPVSVPVDGGGRLRIIGADTILPIHALWPNHVRTSSLPEKGLDGHLIDLGRGRLTELDGKRLEGSIALMGFGSGNAFVEARALGAAAILFYDDGRVTRSEAAAKFLQVPVDIPRFWLEATDAKMLRKHAQSGETQVHLNARMDWQQVQAHNLIAILPGLAEDMPLGQRQKTQQWKDQIIVVQAHYDAISVVPALAPGAESATGIAALLEVARLLVEEGTRYTVIFLATPGHFEGLAGVNDFLYRHARTSAYFRDKMPPADRIDFRLFVGLDLSSHNRQVGSFTMGTFYNSVWGNNDYQKNLMAHYATRFERYNREIFADSTRYQDAIAPQKRVWKNFMPARLALDSEASAFVGKEALSFVTPNQLRQRVDTPLDKLEYVEFDNLAEQTRTIAGLMLKAASDPDFFNDSKLTLRDWGHSLEGNIYWFDRDVNFAVPKAPVPGALVTYLQPGPNSVAGVRTLITTHAQADGEETGYFKFDIMRNRFANKIQAFALDERGRITSAPDLGEEGDKTYPGTQPYGWWENRMLQVLFHCRALSFLEVVDPRYLSAMDRVSILGANDAVPRSFSLSYIENQSGSQDRVVQAGVVFAEPGTRVKILAGEAAFGGESALSGVRYMLTNADSGLFLAPPDPSEVDLATIERAQGRGFPVEQGTIPYPALQAARDIWTLDEARIKQMARHGIVLDELQAMHDDARRALIEAGKKLSAYDYTGYQRAVRRALGIEARIYPEIKSTANDTVRAVIFYFALILPFAFFCERFFFGFPDVRRQIMGFVGFFVGVFLLLRWVHPAFKLSTSPYIIFLAFVILALGLLVVFIVIGRFKSLLAKRRGAAAGLHETDVGRLSASFAAVLLGISNLSKRRLRTALTAMTLTLLTFTVNSFTSVKSSLDFYRLPRDTVPTYEGALVRDRAWRGMQESTLEYVKSAFGDRTLVVPRAWYLSPVESEKAYINFTVNESGRTSFAHGLVGMQPDETRVTHIDQHLTAGRFFTDDDLNTVIIPDSLAALVGIMPVDIGTATISLYGEDYEVIGIFDSAALTEVVDLDGETLTPVDTVKDAALINRENTEDPRTQASMTVETFNHLEVTNTLFLPYQRVINMNGRLRSIAVAADPDDKGFTQRVESFMSRVALTLFVSKGDKVVAYSSIGSTEISGAGQLFIPVLIAALIVLNTMTGAVYERAREIGIYSVVGLAPSHIGMLFLAESTVFATFGAVAGYIVGQISHMLMLQYDLLGGLTLNYSSLSAVWATVVVIGTVYLSTLYPARLAASMAVPDVTRQWQFPVPTGDHWTFDFPFTVGGAEVPSMYVYLKTVFVAYGEGSVGDFIAREVELSTSESEFGTGLASYEIAMRTWLAPYDLGISQVVRLKAIPTGEHRIYKIETHIERLSGDMASWQRMNRNFLNVLRKRFLVWRTLPAGIREGYQERVADEYRRKAADPSHL